MLKSLPIGPLSPARKLTAVFVIATLCTLAALLIRLIPPFRGSVELIDTALFDAFYKHRPQQSKLDSPVVIVAVDQASLDRMTTSNHYGWPWPREYWGAVALYLQKCGAKAIAFDMMFADPSFYNNETGDDQRFAELMQQVSIPVIFGADTTSPHFAPPIKNPRLAAVNVIESAVVRTYVPFIGKVPSLPIKTLQTIDAPIPIWAHDRFLLHYYGPNKHADGSRTFQYVPAFNLIAAAQPDAKPLPLDEQNIFRGKIVLIGATADALFDLKTTPVSALYPGVEIQATAIENMLEDAHVHEFGLTPTLILAWLASVLAAAGALLPRTVWIKLLAALAAAGVLFLTGFLLFTAAAEINWLPLAMPLLATACAIVAALAWTYLVEDRQRRVLLKFLAQYVSPEVAAELNRRGKISLGGVRRDMTVIFTDLEGFADFSESMPVEKLEKFMNFYLSEMSSIIFDLNGTLDKYIGDALMSFWNAPLDQPDHAARACRAALRIRDRERELQRQFVDELGIPLVHTRIGINTGAMVVGNMGSMQKVNYTVVGDAVNVANRLEGSNKLVGSQILVADETVQQVNGQFLFRKLDLLTVKGRKQATVVYELLAEGGGDERLQKLVREFETALAHAQNQNWIEAEKILVALASEFPDDKPTALLLARARTAGLAKEGTS